VRAIGAAPPREAAEPESSQTFPGL
jgi:hypothetical protein